MLIRSISYLYVIALLSFATATSAEVEVVHWWASESESKAINYLADEYEHRGGKWQSTVKLGFSKAREHIISRLANGYYPTAMQWNAGFETSQLYDLGFLRAINEIDKSHQGENYINPVLDLVQTENDIVSLPITLHGESWMWINTHLFKRLNLLPPKTWDELIEISSLLLENKITPIAVGDQSWQVRILFNSILIGVAGPEIYNRFYQQRDTSVLKDEKFIRTLETFVKLREFSNTSKYGVKWNDQVKEVAEGNAAMLFMGDWAKAEFQHMGKQLSIDFDCHLAPQTEDYYLYLVDVFVFGDTQYKDEMAAQRKLLAMLSDDDILYDFNALKGSIPPTKNIDASRLDRCGKIAARLMNIKSAVVKPYAFVVGDGSALSAFDNAIKEVWLTEDINMESMLHKFQVVMKSLDKKNNSFGVNAKN